VEALIGITVIDAEGRDAVEDGGVMVVSFQQTVSDRVITSQFGSYDPVAGSVAHTPQKRAAPKQAPAATVTVKHEYSVESSVKQEYDADSYTPHADVQDSNVYEDYGTADGEEVEYVGEEGDYETEYYEEYDDGSGYPANVKYEPQDGAYMDTAGDGSYMQTEYMSDTYGHSSIGRPPKYKAAKPRMSASGAQLGQSKVRKMGATVAARGGTRPRTGRASQDQATTIAVRELSFDINSNSLCLFVI